MPAAPQFVCMYCHMKYTTTARMASTSTRARNVFMLEFRSRLTKMSRLPLGISRY